jgi:hypothetical protein
MKDKLQAIDCAEQRPSIWEGVPIQTGAISQAVGKQNSRNADKTRIQPATWSCPMLIMSALLEDTETKPQKHGLRR